MRLFRTVSEINVDLQYQSKIAISPTLCVFNAPAEWVPLELGTDARGQNIRMISLPGGQNGYQRVTDRETDRHATTAKTALTHSVARVKSMYYPTQKTVVLIANILDYLVGCLFAFMSLDEMHAFIENLLFTRQMAA